MTKTEYLKKLNRLIKCLNENERAAAVSYYNEQISDRMEEGMTEEQAVADVGDVTAAASKIVSSASKEDFKKHTSLWVKILLALGSPVWAPLLIVAVVVLLCVYLVIWVVLISVAVSVIAVLVAGVAGLLSLVALFSLNKATALLTLGAGLMAIGLALALIKPVIWLFKAIAKATASLIKVIIHHNKGGKTV